MTIVICSGGTGGHIFPAKAVADELVKFLHSSGNKSEKVVFYTDKRSLKYLNNLSSEVEVKLVISGQFVGKSFFQKQKALFLAGLGSLIIAKRFLFSRPKVILSFGGYVSVPLLAVAVIFRIPIILHDQNAVLGRANKLFAKFAKVIITTFKNTKGLENCNKVKFLGNPIRSDFYSLSSENINIKKEGITVLVLGGSQGATVFGKVIPLAFGLLPLSLQEQLKVYHQCRDELKIETLKEWQKTKVKFVIQNFFVNINDILTETDLIITRSGASTIAEVNCAGKAAIYIPFARAADNHQEFNAQAVAYNGCAKVITENQLSVEELYKHLRTLLNKDTLHHMGKLAKIHCTSNATRDVARVVLNFINMDQI